MTTEDGGGADDDYQRSGGYGRGRAQIRSPADALRVDLHSAAIARVRRYDPGYRELADLNSVPSYASINRLNVYADNLQRTHSYFASRGISIGPNAMRNIIVRGSRGITLESTRRAYNRGRRKTAFPVGEKYSRILLHPNRTAAYCPDVTPTVALQGDLLRLIVKNGTPDGRHKIGPDAVVLLLKNRLIGIEIDLSSFTD